MDDVSDDFADLMARGDQAMIILTTASGGERSGCLVGFHSQSGIDPPRYAVWLSKANHTFQVGALADTFAVHFPAADQMELAALFGGETGDEVDKFDRCAWTPGPDGVPLLDDCPNRFVARREGLVDVGADHVCLDLAPLGVDRGPSPEALLRLHHVEGIDPGHGAEERQRPTVPTAGE
ncbi:flavin reductase family protein [Rhabdothermincola salaria]|uniref:flavin reductase family protein n=1 Tax=Rhabdothermincola salaria TaxID=2903142 RepID=UPI001E394F51|nr:flavin reductase family protein [Rhabdothermincola salaria]MCD9624159.1 flavin reductase family protein [Rhabdothermincola salaria]